MNCLGNIFSLVLEVLIIGPGSMFKLILSGNQDLTYWYTNRPVGKNTLGGYIEDMMKGGVEGNFKNHSMRKSTCTRLFRKGMDPQLIKEQTGHKSEAVMLYKKIKYATEKRSFRYVKCVAQGNGAD